MSNKNLPNIIHIGAQKAGSTWIYESLKDHPDVFVPDKEPTSFFNLKYYKGIEWYKSQFEGRSQESAIVDESPGYIKNESAPEKAYETVPDAKILACVRDPVQRAHSQWWYDSSHWINTTFDRFKTYHGAFELYITPGMYYKHLKRWINKFGRENVKIAFFKDMKKSNKKFIQEIYKYIGVDHGYVPKTVGKKVKPAYGEMRSIYLNHIKKYFIKKISKSLSDNLKSKVIKPIISRLGKFTSDYKKLIPLIYRERSSIEKSTRKVLEKIYREDIKKLEKISGRNLDSWLKIIE